MQVSISLGSDATMLSVRVRLALLTGLALSVTVKVKETSDELVVGVPLSTPVTPSKDMSAGKLPRVSVQVYGAVPPLAVSVTE